LILHLPFVLRYDLHFQPDFAISFLMSLSIVEGEWPVFFWGQAYMGTLGNYVTALWFRLFGASIPVAGLVSLGIWAAGVGLTTALAQRLMDRRSACWVGLAAAVASPYANHYITQPCTTYETAPLLAVALMAGLVWARHVMVTPLEARTVAGWAGLGLLVGVGWWTTRLFLPMLATAILVLVLCPLWRGVAFRRAAATFALVVAGCLVGAGPDIAYRLGQVDHFVRDAVAAPGFELEFASPSEIPANLLQSLRALPAYFNGDPLARLPEGTTFSRALLSRRPPYAGPEFAPGPLALLNDAVVSGIVAAILVAAAYTARRAWKQRNLPLLALCAVPFVHLALLSLSGRTGGGYFEARRYWFGSLLVFPLLLGNALSLARGSGITALHILARVLAGLLLISSVVAQARMLALPDELADFRILIRDLEDHGDHAVLMRSGGWLVAALSGGSIDVSGPAIAARRPQMARRVAASDRLVLVVAAGRPVTESRMRLGDTPFVANGSSRRAAKWHLYPFRADPAP
jgi:hypothetical protein